jgi:predicted GNAT superfamily acetyltransferase
MRDMSVAARREADDAALAAGVRIESVGEPSELDDLRATLESIWGAEVVPPRNLLRGMAIGGASLLLARSTADDRAVGFALGWLGWNGGVHLHSHQVGVVATVRASGVGVALKLAQRADCLEHGVTEMRWTFDPMLRANARFNLVRLGARPVAFLPHCYGDRRDAFNTGERTDRLEVSWALDDRVGSVDVEVLPGDTIVPVPLDYPTLRTDEPSRAREWRDEMGRQLADLGTSGRSIIGWCPDGYVVR